MSKTWGYHRAHSPDPGQRKPDTGASRPGSKNQALPASGKSDSTKSENRGTHRWVTGPSLDPWEVPLARVQKSIRKVKLEIQARNDRNRRYIEESLRVIEEFFSLLVPPPEKPSGYGPFDNRRAMNSGVPPLLSAGGYRSRTVGYLLCAQPGPGRPVRPAAGDRCDRP